MRSFRPSPRYLRKLWLIHTLLALTILGSCALLGGLLSLDPDIGSQGFKITLIVGAIAAVLWWVPAMLLAGPYYRSLQYELG